MKTILIVDDDKLIRWSLTELLTQEGYAVDTACSTQEAVQHAGNRPYNLIVADFEIDDEDGLDMLKNLRAAQPEARIIILSALSTQQIESKLSDFSVFAIIEKPFRSEDLCAHVNTALCTPRSVPDTDNHIDPKINKEV